MRENDQVADAKAQLLAAFRLALRLPLVRASVRASHQAKGAKFEIPTIKTRDNAELPEFLKS